MGYIGSSPIDKGRGLFAQDTFTGDGSTTTFDMSNVAPDGGGNDVQVFVDNVRQQEGSSNAYTVGLDGSGDLKRITFTAAPAAAASIYVLNPGTSNVQQISVVSDNAVTTAKINNLAVSSAKIAADAIDATKLADDAVSEEHLDVTAITGNTELSASADDDDVLLVFDTSAGVIKKIQRSNVALSVPTFSSVSPTSLTTGDGTGNHTIVVTGTKFDATATFKLKTDGGTDIAMDSVTRNSATQLTGVVAKSTANLTNANEPFDVIITNGSGLNAEGLNQINIDASPVFVTSAGTLGTVNGGASVSVSVNATDPESNAQAVTFELQSGSLPAGLSLTNTAAEGGTAIISGTATNPVANTTSNFVLRAVDAASNTTSRAFSITVNRVFTSQSFTSSGTFAVPSGVTSLNSVLVVGGGAGGGSQHGGGGGAGGLIFMPEYPVTPGGTLTVTVGDYGAGGQSGNPPNPNAGGGAGQDSVLGAPGDPGKHPSGDVLTAKGGGGGKGSEGAPAIHGGSGGGGQRQDAPAGAGTQPTQPGDSGAYGFGNPGGAALNSPDGGGGGGGAGAAGQAVTGAAGGDGGVGKAYTIADGTSPVFYAGGGGGGGHVPLPAQGGTGGQGGGGEGGRYVGPNGAMTAAGQANKGGGGGGSGASPCAGREGGKGIVIIRY